MTYKAINVPKTGFEPARRFQRYHLKVVRLPISPPGLLSLRFKVSSCSLQVAKLFYFFKIIRKVVPFPTSEFFTLKEPL